MRISAMRLPISPKHTADAVYVAGTCVVVTTHDACHVGCISLYSVSRCIAMAGQWEQARLYRLHSGIIQIAGPQEDEP
jgi:hypothetical protein